MDNNEQITSTLNETNQEIPAQQESMIEYTARFMDEGGVFMWFIAIIWVFGIVIAIERTKRLLQFDIDGASLMNNIKKQVLTNEVGHAIDDCSHSKSLLANVLKNGLKRANQEKEQIQDAVVASYLEAVPLLDKRLNLLALIANVSTLIGLLGTIYGLIQSFAAVASADAASKAELLALGISKAMNTTALGLISAISIMVVHSLLSAKSEKIVGDLEHYSTKLVDLLSTRKPVATKEQKVA